MGMNERAVDSPPTLLIVDDEPDFLRGLARSIPKRSRPKSSRRNKQAKLCV